MAWIWRRCRIRRDSTVAVGAVASSSAPIGCGKDDAALLILSPGDGNLPQIYVGKPLGLVSFGTRIRLPAEVAVVLDWQGKSAEMQLDGAPAGTLPCKTPYNYCLTMPASGMLPLDGRTK